MRKPCNLAELRNFYLSEYRPLYDRFMAENRLPQELHAEVAAAFDHLMRNANDTGKIDSKDLDRVVGHLKRATFDSFKLLFENGIRSKHDRFMESCYADVEDGEFQPRVRMLFNKAVEIAREARSLEHSADDPDVNAWGKAFEKWKELLPIADEFIVMESSPKVQRAQAHGRVKWFWVTADKILWVVIGALLSWLIAKMLG